MDRSDCGSERLWIGAATDGGGGSAATGIRLLGTDATKLVSLGPPAPAGPNPMYLAWDEKRSHLLVANEVSDGRIGAWTPAGRDGDEAGLRQAGPSRSSGGAGPCHISLHPDGWVLVANYGSGSFGALPMSAFGTGAGTRESAGEGAGGPETRSVQYVGSGPDPDRQSGPHAHQAVYDAARDQILVTDLGTDRIHRHRLDAASGHLEDLPDIVLHPGAGPRHLVLVGRHAVVANELDGTVAVVDLDTDPLRAETAIVAGSTWPGPASETAASAIRVSRNGFVYVANRGPNTISAFALSNGVLEPVGETPAHGEHPRDIALSAGEDLLWSANQFSDSLTTFTIDATTGIPTFSGDRFATPSPTCILGVPG